MMLLKSLQWFEWLLIGVVVAVLGVTWVVWDKYDQQLVENVDIKSKNSALVETVKYKDASTTITDVVVTDFIQEKDDVKATQEKSREGVINDYIDMAGRPTVYIPQVVEFPVKAVPQPAPPKIRTPQPKVDTSSSDSARLNLLADRMREHYCAAAPNRGNGCNADRVN